MSAGKSSAKNIWMLSREYGELAGAGGVKDVVKQLATNLARWSGRRISVVLPLYGFMDPKASGFLPLLDSSRGGVPLSFELDMDYPVEERRERVVVWYGKQERVQLYLLEADRFSEKRSVYTYTGEEESEESWKKQGQGHYDYFAMNVLHQKGALELMILLGERPDIIHCHDAHTSILPALVKEIGCLRNYFRDTGTVVTIHNAGVGYHQEINDIPFAQAMTGLRGSVISKGLFNGSFDPFVVAGHYGLINTVSENYGRELQETEDDRLTGWLGHHLLDMGVRLEGVTNGIDPLEVDSKSPERTGIFHPFDLIEDEVLTGKIKCKKKLLKQLHSRKSYDGIKQFGSIKSDVQGPLFTYVGRLSEQKGVDILLEALHLFLLREGSSSVVLLGSGGAELENRICELTGKKEFAGRVVYLKGFNALLANRIYSAGDFLLIPSRYEPCGLTDFIAQLFGNLPIVHHVGGLVKVLDGKTGIAYKENSPDQLISAMMRGVSYFGKPQELREMQRQAVLQIQHKHTWKKVMRRYVELYGKSRAMKIQADS